MKEIVVISGKGGTGKTSITASFAKLCAPDVVMADCDVDAADLHLLLKPDFAKAEDFYSGQYASVAERDCSMCALCIDACRFDAIELTQRGVRVSKMDCEGCAYCSRICPEQILFMKDALAGKLYTSTNRFGSAMVHARLGVGADNSGKLVAKVKKGAQEIAEKNNKDYVLIDGSPGVGCPVISSLAGAHFVVFVTEPTLSGMHDLERVYSLVKKFGIPCGCIVNKCDLNKKMTKRIEGFLRYNNIEHLANLHYDENFTKAMTVGKTIIEVDDGELSIKISRSWARICQIVAK